MMKTENLKLKIVLAPSPILSQEAKPVSKIDSHVKKVIKEMKKALESAKDPEGVGLAAPQIGESLRIFIAKPTLKSSAIVFINPKIVKLTDHGLQSTAVVRRQKAISKKKQLEGCLSLKDIWGTVQRSPKLTLSYMDETGKTYKKEFTGFLATIIQHENDHLNGILFPKRVLEQKGKLYKSEKDEKGEDVFEEIEI